MTQQKTHRLAYALSTTVSIMLAWMYFGFYPLGQKYGYFPPHEGSLLNELMRYVAVPLTLVVIIGGGLSAGSAIASNVLLLESERRSFALCAAPGVLWVAGVGVGLVSSTQGSLVSSASILGMTVFLAYTIQIRLLRFGIVV